jgi:two-component system, cell cycle sensor histidine kinase and response regulator CckA
MLDEYKGSELILVADDEPVVLTLAETILKSYGYRVVIAKDGAEALEVHRQTGPIDLLLTDVVMPRMSGPELAHVLKQEAEDFRCIFMSGYDQDQIRDRGVKDMTCDYLRKPFKPVDLLKKIRATLDSDSGFTGDKRSPTSGR